MKICDHSIQYGNKYFKIILLDALNDLVVKCYKFIFQQFLVFFRNGAAKIVDIQALNISSCEPFLISQDRFNTVEVQPDGYGVYWNDRAMVSHRDLYTHGISVPFTQQDLHQYVQTRVVSASEACGILECSRQNIDDLMRRDKLHPIRTDAKYKLFSKAEVMQRRKE